MQRARSRLPRDSGGGQRRTSAAGYRLAEGRATVRQVPDLVEEFLLHPAPPSLGECPRGHGPLVLNTIRPTGWRFYGDTLCTVCNHRYLHELPSGHALYYPTVIDVTTGEVFGKWFDREAVENYLMPDVAPVAVDVTVSRSVTNATLLNCLDPVYGHALLRLFNATRHIESSTDSDGVVVIVPGALESMVPDGVAEQWVVREPFVRFRNWLDQFEEFVTGQVQRFASARLSFGYPHPHPSTYALGDYTGAKGSGRGEAPSFIFPVRPDRAWGGSGARQRRHVIELFERLRKAFPAAEGVVIGFDAPWPDATPGLRVMTASRGSADEEGWAKAMAGADLAIGVHGSNMLLPSAFAKGVVELVPAHRYGNPLQATLVSETDALLALYSHRFIYGDDELHDVTPARVAAIAIPMLQDREAFRAYFAGRFAGVSEPGTIKWPTGRGGWTAGANVQRDGWQRRVLRRSSPDLASELETVITQTMGNAPIRLPPDEALAVVSRSDDKQLPLAPIITDIAYEGRAGFLRRAEARGWGLRIVRKGRLVPGRFIEQDRNDSACWVWIIPPGHPSHPALNDASPR